MKKNLPGLRNGSSGVKKTNIWKVQPLKGEVDVITVLFRLFVVSFLAAFSLFILVVTLSLALGPRQSEIEVISQRKVGSQVLGATTDASTSNESFFAGVVRTIFSPIGRINQWLIKTSDKDTTEIVDPLTTKELNEIFELNEAGDVVVKKKLILIESPATKSIGPIGWNEIKGTPSLLSSINSVEGVAGNIKLAEGNNITITGDKSKNTITISSTGSAVVTGNVDVNLTAGSGISVSGASPDFTIANTSLGSSQNIFKNVAVSGQSTVVADSNNDTLTFAAGAGIAITTSASADRVTIASSGGGNADTLDTLDSLQFLRSDTSDSFTSGTLTIAGGTTLSVAGSLTCTDCITLGGETAGNYVASVAAGSGLTGGAGGSEGAALTLSLSDLTADWTQSGAFDIVLANAGSELQILESVGGTFYGTLDVGDLSANRTYTLPDAAGTVCISGGTCSASAVSFSGITTGTNTSAAMVVGTGASLGVSGTGTITATDLVASSSVVSDAEVDNNISIDATGSVNWSALSSYPAACAAGSAVSTLADSPTCTAFTRAGVAETITGGWTFNTAATTFTTGINADGGVSTTAGDLTLGSTSGNINIGTSTLTGTTAVIDFNDFDVSNDGHITLTPNVIFPSANYMDIIAPSTFVASSTVINVYGISSAGDLSTTIDASGETIDWRGINLTLPAINSAQEATDTINLVGILITAGAITNGAGTETSIAIDVSDADIVTGLALGSNDVSVGGTTISSSEFALLDGHDAALVDTNDAVGTAITGTGVLTSGSIAAGFGTISTANTISGTVLTATTAASGLVIGAGANATTLSSTATSARAISFPDEDGTICTTGSVCAGYQASGSYANTALSNLAAVAINTTLLPNAAGTIHLGSGTLPFGDIFLAGTSGTPGTNNFRITGASTSGIRTITLPDESGTVCTNTSVCSAYSPVAGSASITTVGALSSGSIAAGFGAISTSNTITGTTLNGTTGINTGSGAGTQRIDASGNLVAIGNITGTGAIVLASGGAGALSLDSASGVVTIAAGDTLGNGTWSISSTGVGSTLTSTDLSCTNCINATEIEDIYVLTAGDTMTGNLSVVNSTGITSGQNLLVDGNSSGAAFSDVSGANITFAPVAVSGLDNFATIAALMAQTDTITMTNSGADDASMSWVVGIQVAGATDGTITKNSTAILSNLAGILIKDPTLDDVDLTVTNPYGIYIEDWGADGATFTNTPYAIYQAGTDDDIYFASNEFRIGQGSATDDDFLYFDTTGSSEWLSWDDSPGEFDLSDDLDVVGHGAFGSEGVVSTAATLDLDIGSLTADHDGLTIEVSSTGASTGITMRGIFANVLSAADSGADTIIIYDADMTFIGNAVAPTETYGLRVQEPSQTVGTDPTTSYGIRIHDQSLAGTTTSYGIYIDDVNAGTNKYGIYVAGGDTYAIWVDTDPVRFDGLVNAGLGSTASTTAVCSSLAGATAPTAGTAYELRDCSGTPAADYMEMYSVEQDVEPGDIVATGSNSITTEDGDILVKLAKSSISYQKNIIGIVSDPADATDFNSIGYNIRGEDNPMPVALNGRVKIKVSIENGPIEIGDPLTSSSTPGVAMKATNSGPIVGKALESYTSSGVGKIMVFVSVGWYVESISNVNPPAGGSNLDGLTSISTQTLTAGTITTDVLFIGDEKLSLNSDGWLQLEGDFEITGDLKVAGEITAKKVNVSDEAAGSSTLKAGQTKIEIETTLVTDESQVLITLNTLTEKAIAVTEKEEGKGFTVEITAPEVKDIDFDWLVIN